MSDFVPLQRKIADIITDRIRKRKWKYGEKLPSIKKLCEEFEVSTITVKAALKILQANGMIRTVKGSGSFADWKREKDYSFRTTNSSQFSSRIQITHAVFCPTPLHKYIVRQLADTFMRNNPGIAVNIVDIRPQGVSDPYMELFSSGTPPTCGEFFWHALYSKRDALYPLEELPDFDVLANDLLPQAVYPTENSCGEKHIHALYLLFDIPHFLIVNLNKLHKAGIKEPSLSIDWETLLKNAEILARSNKCHPVGILRPHSFHNVKQYLELLGQDIWATGKVPFSQEVIEEIFDTDGAGRALEYLRRLFDTGNILTQQSHENFAFERVGMLPFSNSWSLHLLEMLNPSAESYAYPMPLLSPHKCYYPFRSGYNVGIFRQAIRRSGQLQAAWEWLQFLFYKESQTLFSQNLYLPVRSGVTPYMYEKFPFLSLIVRSQLKNSVPQPDFVGLRQMLTLIGREICNFMDGDISPDDCLQNLRKSLRGTDKMI